MSQENVEIVRRVYERWNNGDLAGWKEMHAPDVVVVPPEGWPEGDTSTNRDAWFDQAMRLRDSWDAQRLEVDEIRDLGDRLLSFLRWVTRGKDSGIELETPMASVTTVEGGKIVEQSYFLDQQSALKAVGLSE